MINKMSPRALCGRLEWVEVGDYPADMRRVLRDERQSLTLALRTGDATKIVTAASEARRVAAMWGLT